jgi:hypothetical protein
MYRYFKEKQQDQGTKQPDTYRMVHTGNLQSY